MLNLKKPNMLKPNDLVASVSLSWGGAGDKKYRWRYELGKERIQKKLGLRIIETQNTLKGSKFLSMHPEKKAEDLMEAFLNKDIKAIFSCIGGSGNIDIIPYLDFNVIRNNPKIFLGYSDSTITHFICLKCGFRSFYGPSILAEFAENYDVYEYTLSSIKQSLFTSEIPGYIFISNYWTSEYIEWLEKNRLLQKKMKKNNGYEIINGNGTVEGTLVGGCLEVLEILKRTTLWPENDLIKDTILFFETSDDCPSPLLVEEWLIDYLKRGIFEKIKGIIWGKPNSEVYYNEYKEVIKRVMKKADLLHVPILYNASFGHNEPMMCIPYGALGEINCDTTTFRILDCSCQKPYQAIYTGG